MSINKSYLVTGADGFIGSHLFEFLQDKGHTVRAFITILRVVGMA